MIQIGIWILLFSVCGRTDAYIRQPAIDVIHYDISIEWLDTPDSIAGKTKIRVAIRNEPVSHMWLDCSGMTVDGLWINGNNTQFKHRDDRLSFSFDRTYLPNEPVFIEVHYHRTLQNGGILIKENIYGQKVIFTDSWPDLSHHWFPSIDHPSDKATSTVTVTAPRRYHVVSNGVLAETSSLNDGRTVTRWIQNQPIPTYSIAIGIAEFTILRQPDINNIQLSWYAYPQDAEAADEKFKRTEQILTFYDTLIGPYPYAKLAQVESSIRMQAMENANTVFYSESSLQKTPVPETPVPHELAHQWFGNSVTPADWDHLWLSEGFATYFSALFYEYLYGPQWLQQTMAGYAETLEAYPAARHASVIDPTQSDMMKKLNPVNYEKGAWILHMLRGMLGDRVFFESIRSYYRLYKGGNAMSGDFRKVVETVSGMSLGNFFRQWLHQPGWPQYQISWKWNENAQEAEVRIVQTQTTGIFDMPLDLAFKTGKQREIYRARLAGRQQKLRIPLKRKPSILEIDPGGWFLKSVEMGAF